MSAEPAPPRRRRVDGATPPLAERPGPGGRVHATTRRVRLGDVGRDARARMDALARYLQDVAADDVRDAGTADDRRWVVRRTYLGIRRRPRYEEPLELATWCSGTGAAWAERRTSIRGEGGAAVEAVSLWVSLDPVTMRPAPTGARFDAVYGPAAGGRQVRARLQHPDPPPGAAASEWALRAGDFDVLGHVNNAVTWGLLDEEVERRLPGHRVGSAEVEYREPIAGGRAVTVLVTSGEGILRLWALTDGGTVACTALARVEPGAAPHRR